MDNQNEPFDPQTHVTKLKGRPYLEVKWRIAWMRSSHPDAIVETDLVDHTGGRAIVRARVTLPNGASATGWGSVLDNAFENYIEKAETKALGRALAALGFGIQFADLGDSDDTNDQGGQSGGGPAQARSRPNGQQGGGQQGNYMMTAAQKSRIERLAGEQNLDGAALDHLIHQHTGERMASINKRQASGIIDLLESRRTPGTTVSPNGPAPDRNQGGQQPNRREGSITGQQIQSVRNLQARLGWSEQKLNDFIMEPLDVLPEFGAEKLIRDLNKILTEGEIG